MTETYATRDDADPILQDAISLCAQLEVVRKGLRVQINNLTRPVKERKKIYADLRAKEDALVERIETVIPHLSIDHGKWIQQRAGKKGVQVEAIK